MRPWRLSLSLVAMAAASTLATVPCTVGAQAPTREAPQLCHYLGQVGPYRVGLDVIVAADHKTVLRAHYFYASKLTDIPLHPAAGMGPVTLVEPSGGEFDLRFVGNGSARPPLDFYTSVGLAGRWSQGGRSLPVTLQLETVRDEPAPGHWYDIIADGSDARVEANARRFLQGVISGNREEAASAVSYPLQINGPHLYRITDRAALLAHWNAIFTPGYVAVLKTAAPHEMFVNDRGAMVADGAAWFDAKGASALNLAFGSARPPSP